MMGLAVDMKLLDGNARLARVQFDFKVLKPEAAAAGGASRI